MEMLNQYLRSLLSSCGDELRLEPDKKPYINSDNKATDVGNIPLMGTQISTMVFPLIPPEVKSALPNQNEVDFEHPNELGNFNFKIQKSPAGFIVTIRPVINASSSRLSPALPDAAPDYASLAEAPAANFELESSSMAGPNGQMITFQADGTRQTETSPRGRTVTTSVTATDRDLTINYEGDRMNDYYVSFMPMRDGQLQVTRRVYLEGQNETVTAVSVYDKVSPNPQWAQGSVGSNNAPLGQNVNAYLIANNTPIVATLDTPLSTRNSRDGEPFTMPAARKISRPRPNL